MLATTTFSKGESGTIKGYAIFVSDPVLSPRCFAVPRMGRSQARLRKRFSRTKFNTVGVSNVQSADSKVH